VVEPFPAFWDVSRDVLCVCVELTRLRSRLGSVLNMAVVLSGDESYEVADDKLVEVAADIVKRNTVLTNQIEVLLLLLLLLITYI